MDIPVKKVVIELKNPQFCQLIHSYPNLEWPSYGDPWLPAFYLLRLTHLVKIAEIRASKGLVYDLIFSIDHVGLLLQSVDEFLVPTVSQQFEHISKQHIAFFLHLLYNLPPLPAQQTR